jgi:hypothetical protein
MIIIELNPMEKALLLLYAEHSLFDSSHWGGSTFLTPEEQIVYDSVKNVDKTLNLSLSQFTILFEWVLSATFRGTILSPDDTALLCKFSIAIKSYYTYLKNMYDNDIRLTENIIQKLEQIHPPSEVQGKIDSNDLKVECICIKEIQGNDVIELRFRIHEFSDSALFDHLAEGPTAYQPGVFELYLQEAHTRGITTDEAQIKAIQKAKKQEEIKKDGKFLIIVGYFSLILFFLPAAIVPSIALLTNRSASGAPVYSKPHRIHAYIFGVINILEIITMLLVFLGITT